jgi:hypothetical protein
MKKRIVLKESQLIDMIEKIVKQTQAKNLAEAEKKSVQSNSMGKKKASTSAEPFEKKAEGKKEIGGSIPSSIKVKKGPSGGSKAPQKSVSKVAKLAKNNPSYGANKVVKKKGI